MKRFCLFMAILWATLPALCHCGPDLHYLQQGETEHSSAPIEYVYIHSDDAPLEYQNATNAHFGFHEGNLYYRDKSVLYRIEPMSGTKTSVCHDPVCEHLDAGCPVFSISSAFCFENGIFYFDRLVMNGAQMRESEPPRADEMSAKIKCSAPHVLCISASENTRGADSMELAKRKAPRDARCFSFW